MKHINLFLYLKFLMMFCRINIYFVLTLIVLVVGKELPLRFYWKEIDFEFESSDSRHNAINNKEYIPENCIPSGIEIWKDKFFVATPRYKNGVPSTLNYVKLDTLEKSPLLIPYPSWKENNLTTGTLKSLHHITVDSCHRLWSVDHSPDPLLSPYPKLIILNLETNVISSYNLSQHSSSKSSFTNLLIDESKSCSEIFAYIADSRDPALIVYSLKEQRSWRINHPYFSFDPLSTSYNVNGISYRISSGVIGLTLFNTKFNRNVLFHPMSSNYIFNVSTSILQKPAEKYDDNDFTILGKKGDGFQSYCSYFHERSGILFYNVINRNGIGCWNFKKFPKEFSDGTNEVVVQDDEGLVFVSELRGDGDVLWIMSNKLPILTKKGFRKDEINFRVFSVNVSSLIEGTVCDEIRKRSIIPMTTVTYY